MSGSLEGSCSIIFGFYRNVLERLDDLPSQEEVLSRYLPMAAPCRTRFLLLMSLNEGLGQDRRLICGRDVMVQPGHILQGIVHVVSVTFPGFL